MQLLRQVHLPIKHQKANGGKAIWRQDTIVMMNIL